MNMKSSRKKKSGEIGKSSVIPVPTRQVLTESLMEIFVSPDTVHFPVSEEFSSAGHGQSHYFSHQRGKESQVILLGSVSTYYSMRDKHCLGV